MDDRRAIRSLIRGVGVSAEGSWTYEELRRVGDSEEGQRESLVQDPDGYLLRFVEATT